MKLHKVLALGLVLGTATAAYANSNNATIIGGTDVDANDPVASTTVLIVGQVPAPASQTAQNSNGQPPQPETYLCTGSILDTDLVVTAAHCVAAAPENIRVVFARDINNNAQIDKSQVMPITGYVANPGWQGEQSTGPDQHDIALIHLAGTVPAPYHPATLLSAEDSQNLKKGDTALLAGYGITNAQTQDGSGTLREVDVKVTKQLGQTEVVLDQRKGKGACHGDSGGPAFSQGSDGQLLLWGVTNRGYPDNAPDNCKEYVVYTRIAAYADFLQQAATQLRAQQQ